MLVMPGILPVLGRTRQEAQDRYEATPKPGQRPQLGLPMLSRLLRRPLQPRSRRPPPARRSHGHNAVKSPPTRNSQRLAQQPGMTIRKLYQIMAGASGHNFVVGSVTDIADLMEDWFTSPRLRRLQPHAPLPPRPGDRIRSTWLIPELQRRGLFAHRLRRRRHASAAASAWHAPCTAAHRTPRPLTPISGPPGHAHRPVHAWLSSRRSCPAAAWARRPNPSHVENAASRTWSNCLPERIATSNPLTVAVALGSPPDDFRNAQGEINGWEIDILTAASQALGLQLELRPTTFDTLIPGLQAKRFDAAVGQMGVTEVRRESPRHDRHPQRQRTLRRPRPPPTSRSTH